MQVLSVFLAVVNVHCCCSSRPLKYVKKGTRYAGRYCTWHCRSRMKSHLMFCYFFPWSMRAYTGISSLLSLFFTTRNIKIVGRVFLGGHREPLYFFPTITRLSPGRVTWPPLQLFKNSSEWGVVQKNWPQISLAESKSVNLRWEIVWRN